MLRFHLKILIIIIVGVHCTHADPLPCELRWPRYPTIEVEVPVYVELNYVPKNHETYAVRDNVSNRIRVFEYWHERNCWLEWYRDMPWLVNITINSCVAYDNNVYQYEIKVVNSESSLGPVKTIQIQCADGDSIIKSDKWTNCSEQLVPKPIWPICIRAIDMYDIETHKMPFIADVGCVGNVRFCSLMLPGPGQCYASRPADIIATPYNRRSAYDGEDILSYKGQTAFTRLLSGSAYGITMTPLYDPAWPTKELLSRIIADLPLFLEGCWVDTLDTLLPIKEPLEKALDLLGSDAPDKVAVEAVLTQARSAADALSEKQTLRREGWDVIRFNVAHMLTQLKTSS